MAPPKATWNGKDSQGNPLRWGMPRLTWNGDIPQTSTTSKKMPALHVLIGFDNMKDTDIETLAGAVSKGFYGNPDFPDPPDTLPTKEVFDAALDAFTKAIPIAEQGGPADTAAKNNKRAALIELLRKVAAHVQANHGNDLAKLLSTGFKAGKTGRAPAAMTAPVIKGIKNGISGQLLPQIAAIANARGYEPRSAAIGADGMQGPWVMGEFSANTRDLAINGLTPGVLYAVQVRALGGSDRHSDWSDTVQHRAM
jgi:hypothetical protein